MTEYPRDYLGDYIKHKNDSEPLSSVYAGGLRDAKSYMRGIGVYILTC